MNESVRVRARKFLQEFFSDDDLTTFCFDYFPQVYNDFTLGMLKSQKARMLVENSEYQGRFNELLAALERERPKVYQEHFSQKSQISVQVPQIVKRNQQQIFISHAHQDVEFAQRLAGDLRSNGWQTWMAPNDIRPGEKWVEAINRGLSESGIFVLLLTPEAVVSRWVQSEMNVAIGMEHRREIRLIPLSLKLANAPAMWSAYQWIKFDSGYESGFAYLLNELESEEGKKFNSDNVRQTVSPEKSKEISYDIGNKTTSLIQENEPSLTQKHSEFHKSRVTNAPAKTPVAQRIIKGLTVATALIHIVLGVMSGGAFLVIFLLNGLGYLALLAGLYFLPQLAGQRSLIRWALLAFTAVTFILYFVFNWPDIWGPIGIADKLIELILIIFLWQEK